MKIKNLGMWLMAAVAGVGLVAGCASGPDAGKKPLRVGTSADYPPITYAEGDQLLGSTIDEAQMAGAWLGRPVELVRLPFGDLIDKLNAGEIDVIMSGMTATPERRKKVAFASSYMTVTLTGVCRATDAAKYKNDLDVKKAAVKVGAQAATTAADFMRTYCFGATEKVVADPYTAPGKLLAGELDLYLTDSPAADWMAGANEGELAVIDVVLMSQDLAWAVRKNDHGLEREFNAMVKAWRKSGALDAVLSRWVPGELGDAEAKAKAAGLGQSVLMLGLKAGDAAAGQTAKVYVDGKLERDWNLQHRVWLAVYLTPGEHVVKVQADGYADAEKTVALPVGRGSWVTMKLSPAAK